MPIFKNIYIGRHIGVGNFLIPNIGISIGPQKSISVGLQLGEQCLHVKQVQAWPAAVCEHTEGTDAMPEELVRLVKKLPFICLPLW